MFFFFLLEFLIVLATFYLLTQKSLFLFSTAYIFKTSSQLSVCVTAHFTEGGGRTNTYKTIWFIFPSLVLIAHDESTALGGLK